MIGETELSALLAGLAPTLADGEFVFVTNPDWSYGDGADLHPVAAVTEEEGLTLVIPRADADRARLAYDAVFRRITLRVHSSLEAVGLTAAVADRLARAGISANVVAGFYHDHVFVAADRAEYALTCL